MNRVSRALVVCVALTALAGPPTAAAKYRLEHLQPVSSTDPFDGRDCGLKVSPPLDNTKFRPADTAFEPVAAVNPTDPDNIVAVWTQDYSKAHVVASTHDGGRTWTRSIPPGLTDCTGGEHQAAFDPWISFDRAGTAYISAMSGEVPLGGTAPDNVVAVNRSTDGGVTWSAPTEAEPATGYNDGPSIVALSDRPGHVLTAWARHDLAFGGHTTALRLSESTDGARTWSAPRDVYVPPPVQFVAASELTELSDGTLVWTYGIFDSISQLFPHELAPPRSMEALVSRDRGKTWSAPIKLGEQSRRHTVRDDEGDTEIEREYGPSVTALAGGGAVATWSDVRADGSGVVLVTKTPDGRTWSPPVRAVTSPAPVYTPMIAQSGDGRLGLTWTDLRRDVPGDEPLSAEQRFASSADGRRWSTSQGVAGPFDMRQAWLDPRSVPLPAYNLGEYTGFVGVRRGFVSVFTASAPVARIGRSQAFAVTIRRARP